MVDKIKASLLHALIIAIVGAGTSHGRAAITLARKEESKEDVATILVDGTRATRAGADFAPRITILMQDGTRHMDEFQGAELKWDLATETRRISDLFDDIDWPRKRLDSIVHMVAGLEGQTSVYPLIKQCVAE